MGVRLYHQFFENLQLIFKIFLGHHWFLAKLDIINILLLDYYGGVKVVDVDEYLNVKL